MNDNFLLSNEIKFEEKPEAIPYQYRLSYKTSIIMLIMKINCGRSGCSLTKIHILIAALYSKHEAENLNKFLNNSFSYHPPLKFDPTINITINFMLADELIFQQQNGLFRLTKKGTTFSNNILKDKELLLEEKNYLLQISTRLSETVISSSLKNKRNDYYA